MNELIIENFKSISKASIKLKPITVLCGANSCGKSSVIKSLLFQKQILEECSSSEDPIPYNGKYVKLGSPNIVVTRNSDSDTFCLGFSIPFKSFFQYYTFGQNMRESKIKKAQLFTNGFMENSISYVTYFDAHLRKITKFIINFDGSGTDLHDHFILIEEQSNNASHKWNYQAKGLIGLISFLYMVSSESFGSHINKYSQSSDKSWSMKGLSKVGESSGTCVVSVIGGVPQVRADRGKWSDFTLSELINIVQEDYESINKNSKELSDSIYAQIFNWFADFYKTHCFRNVTYLGPLREEPNRSYQYDDIIRNVGIRGENAPEIFRRYKDRLDEFFFLKRDNIAPAFSGPLTLQERLDRCCDILGIDHFSYEDGILKCGNDNISDVGFGISQLFPILLQSLISKGDYLLLEQPEIHLHPSMQMNLADILIGEAYIGKQYIIETHSDHMINRFVRRIVEDGLIGYSLEIKDLIQLYFVEKDNQGHAKFTEVEVSPECGIVNWPKGFFDQSILDQDAIVRAAVRQKILSIEEGNRQ